MLLGDWLIPENNEQATLHVNMPNKIGTHKFGLPKLPIATYHRLNNNFIIKSIQHILQNFPLQVFFIKGHNCLNDMKT